MEEETNDSKLEECFVQLMKEQFEQRLVNLVDLGVSEHPAVQAISVSDLRLTFNHLCTAAGVPSHLQTTGEKIAWLRAKTYKRLKHREHVKIYLRHLVTNRCYKMHFTFASDPPSLSDASSEKRKGRQSLIPKVWATIILGWLKRSKDPALAETKAYLGRFWRHNV